MRINSNWLHLPLLALLAGAVPLSVSAQTSTEFQALPPTLSDGSDPFVMISLSVELTQQAEAYTDGAQTLVGGAECKGFDGGYGVCYFDTETYLGYFDSKKCYLYVTGTDATATQLATGAQNSLNPSHFKPNSLANADYTCNGSEEFSGNFMNWATMTALDEFRMVMTGGARLVDTTGASAKTLLTRTHRYGDWGFRNKKISGASSGTYALDTGGIAVVNDPSKLTKFNSVTGLQIINNNGNNGNRVTFRDQDGNNSEEFNVIVSACETGVSLEDNCVAYTDGTDTWYKPEGQMQQHALNMRFALMTYTGKDGNGIDGGVLRSNAKYIGATRPATTGGLETNPVAEVAADGTFIFNADGATLTSGVNNSGIINYINSFALSSEKYKSNDPVSELYWEGLRYFKNLGPTLAYSSGITDSQKDNYPVLTTWDDPIASECQANFMISIGDQFSHADNNLPGVTLGNSTPPAEVEGINARTETNTVGDLQGISNLGDVSRGRTNSGYWIAGLAYWAHTNDIRPEIVDGEEVFPGDQTIKTFTVDTQEYNGNPPTGQDNQFWMAAKYGGFNDANGDDDPGNGVAGANTTEWDEDGDGSPDTYTLSSQPADLQEGLSAAFTEIAERISAGSAAAVVANSTTGAGAVYQALYKPEETDDDGRQVQWVGLVRAIMVDEYGNFREDTNEDGLVTNDDYIITLSYDDSVEKTVVERYTTTDGGATKTHSGLAATDVDDLKALWDAKDQLASLTNVATQRVYTSSAGLGRHILTGIDSDYSGQVDSDELVDFDATVFENVSDASGSTANNFRLLGLETAEGDTAEDIVNYIRGQEKSGYRSRTVDINNDGSLNVWRLGDIVHSSPVAVGRPSANYNTIYRDDTYGDFLAHYANRRQMVYAGSNDGMLHAFNAGFFDFSTSSFSVDGGDGVTQHPLGSEMWAYVPYNLLPHLRWLTEDGYPHVYYVDGIPQVFDVNIFDDDEDHPEGWGTILVVGMRLGGGEITLDPDSDTDGDTSDDQTFRSAYVILDITNPEKPPELVAEITDDQIGYTTMRPVVIKNRKPATSGGYSVPLKNEWYLMFGSGPAGTDANSKLDALETAVSNQPAKLYTFNLKTKSFVIPDPTDAPGIASRDIADSSAGYVGDMSAMDWNLDYTDDVVYFGTIEDSVSAPTGQLKRFMPGTNFSITAATVNNLLTDTGGLDKPVMAPPEPYLDVRGNAWVYVGTGRFMVTADNLSSSQQFYAGIKEPRDSDNDYTWATVNLTDLVDTTGFRVFRDGSLTTASKGVVSIDGNDITSFTALQNVIDDESGWFFEFDSSAARHLGKSAISRVSVVFTEYTPTGTSCDAEGQTLLNAVHYTTGTASAFGALGEGTDYFNVTDNLESLKSVEFGHGLVRDVVLEGDRVIGQDSTGGLPVQQIFGPAAASGRTSWREIELE